MVAKEGEEEFEKEFECEEDGSQEDMPFTTGAIISASLYRHNRLKEKEESRVDKIDN